MVTEVPATGLSLSKSDLARIVGEPVRDPFGELDLRLDLRTALDRLSGYDLLLLYAVFDARMTLERISEILSISRQAVDRRIERIVARMRKQMSS